MDPSRSLTGAWVNNSWLTPMLDRYDYKFNIDLDSQHVITRIYYENFHDRGGATENGAKTVYFYGSNSYDAFINFEYSNTTDLTLLWNGNFLKHVRADQADPHYIKIYNTNAYQYYILRILNSWDGNAGIGLRRLVLEESI